MRYAYFQWDDRLWSSLLGFQNLRELFHYLVTMTSGDVEEALATMEQLRDRGILPADTDLESFRKQLEEAEEIRSGGDGTMSLTRRGERSLRRTALETVFGQLKRKGLGDHPVPWSGTGGEPTTEVRPYRFGDDIRQVDFRRSYHNALRRLATGGDHRLQEEDLEVRETEHLSNCATVLLLDISHSMILYGEDRITPAKQVALALIDLIVTKYPKDTLDVVLFGDEAIPIDLDQVPYVQVGPFHTNTKAALQAARRILRRRKQANKQVIMITDGKPSVIIDEDGVPYRNTFGLDPRIVSKTLDEAIALRRERIPIITFMITEDPYLQRFVEQLTERNRGRAYFTGTGQLGGTVLVDFVRNRRRRLR